MLAKFSLAYAQEHLLTAELVQVHDPEVAEALLYRLRFLTSSPDDRSEARQLLTRCYELVKPSSLKGFKLLLDNIGAIERFGTAEQARSLATVMIQSLVAADEHQEIALETSRLLRTAATFYEMLKMREGILHALDAQLSQMTTTTAKKPKNELHLRRLIAVIAYLPTSYIGLCRQASCPRCDRRRAHTIIPVASDHWHSPQQRRFPAGDVVGIAAMGCARRRLGRPARGPFDLRMIIFKVGFFFQPK